MWRNPFRSIAAGAACTLMMLSDGGGGAAAGPLPETGEVIEVIDGDTIRLKEGYIVRLVGIQAPKLALGRDGFQDWPLAEAAAARLTALTLGRRVKLEFLGETSRDRHGRYLAHLWDPGTGIWIQGTLLEEGWARVYSFADQRHRIGAMLAREQMARTAKRGIWVHPFYEIYSDQALLRLGRQAAGGFHLVEGRIAKVEQPKRRIFLNFGENWRKDVTAAIDPEALPMFDGSALAPQSLAGRCVRIRGWVTWENGPMIEITHPEQIEVLDDRQCRSGA